MNRRSFLTTCAAATAAGAIGRATVLKRMPVLAAPPVDKPFSKVRLRMSVPLDFFPSKDPLQRLEEAAAWGLSAYEWLNPGGDADAIRKKADSLGLELSCMVGCGRIGPGTMVTLEDHDKVVDQFKGRLALAKKLNCQHLVGLTGNERSDISREQQTENVITCLKRLAPIAEENKVFLVVEALNPLVDHKGYFLTRTDQTMAILKAVGSPNVKMLFDIYHQQITEGNVIRNIKENIDSIGHFHVADNPGRKEPGTGELNYTNIFKAISDSGYKHFVALECGHTKNYEETLKATLACLNWA
jgi:hydroxypyruvate isomerase